MSKFESSSAGVPNASSSAFSMSSPVVVMGLVGLLVVAFLRILRIGARGKNLPPGPPTTPLLGNLLQIPPRYAHLKFMEWSKQYGPVISLKLFGSNMVVLNDATSVREILDRRSATSSDRPPMHINDDLIAKGSHILLANGQRSALYRRMWNITLAKERVADHLPLQHAEGNAVLYNILTNPDGFYNEMRRYSASLTLCIAYGKRAPTYDGVDASGFSVKEFYRLEHEFNFFLEVGAAPPIDLLPALKYLPEVMAPWKAAARKCRRDMKGLYEQKMLKEIKLKMAKGMRTDCWMEKIIDRNDGLSDECLAWNGGVMMEGGSDTTSGALLTFTLACVLHPETLKPAWAELDEVVGSERSPTFEDIEKLPYCHAFIKEVMRWRPRFMQSEFGCKKGVNDKDMRWSLPYGAGRRICLGMYLAENSLKINFPKLLWAFRYDRKTDPRTGKAIPVSRDAFEPGHLTAPLPFQCDIRPRTAEIAETIRREYAEARGLLEKYEVSIPVD